MAARATAARAAISFAGFTQQKREERAQPVFAPNRIAPKKKGKKGKKRKALVVVVKRFGSHSFLRIKSESDTITLRQVEISKISNVYLNTKMKLPSVSVIRLSLLTVLTFQVGFAPALGQSMTAQKSVVAFIFGTVHPLNQDKTPMKDPAGKPLEVDMPLGTGFFVSYPDTRGGPNFIFGYFVTAKHVLRDFDGKYLPKVSVRLNRKSDPGQAGVDFITRLSKLGL